MPWNNLNNLNPVTVVGGLALAALFIWSLYWTYKDAKARDKQPLLVVALVALLNWPVSLLLWLVIRPNKK